MKRSNSMRPPLETRVHILLHFSAERSRSIDRHDGAISMPDRSELSQHRFGDAGRRADRRSLHPARDREVPWLSVATHLATRSVPVNWLSPATGVRKGVSGARFWKSLCPRADNSDRHGRTSYRPRWRKWLSSSGVPRIGRVLSKGLVDAYRATLPRPVSPLLPPHGRPSHTAMCGIR